MILQKRKLRLKEAYDNIYNTDEILEVLQTFQDTDGYGGKLSCVCLLLSIKPEEP